MYHSISTQTGPLTIDLRPAGALPMNIEFTLQAGSIHRLSVVDFQWLRQNILPKPDGTEDIIGTIKRFRGLTGLTLRDAKEICCWMRDNVDRYASLRG